MGWDGKVVNKQVVEIEKGWIEDGIKRINGGFGGEKT